MSPQPVTGMTLSILKTYILYGRIGVGLDYYLLPDESGTLCVGVDFIVVLYREWMLVFVFNDCASVTYFFFFYIISKYA